MKLIITGPDYAGKSTVLQQLWEKYNDGKMSYIHLSYREPTDKLFYEETLEFSSFLMDRCFIDELIYPNVFNRQQNLEFDEALYLINKCAEKQIPILIFTCSDEELKRRIMQRVDIEEEPEVLQNILDIRDKYLKFAEVFKLPVVDTSNKTPEELAEYIEGYLNMYNSPLGREY